MKNYIQPGTRMTWTNGTGAAVASGAPVIINGRVFVATAIIPSLAIGILAALDGVFEFAKETGKSFAQVADVYWDAVAGRVTSDRDLGAGVGVAVAGNTGNGTITAAPTVAVTASAGVYRIICVEPGVNVGSFAVENPDGVTIGVAIVGVAFTNQLTFTIADGAVDFIVGDAFTITVAAGNSKIGYAHVAAANGDTLASVAINR